MPQFTEWDSFYVIVGSSAAALTGLMFIVITLIADSPAPRSGGTLAAFGTPNIVHFCAALILSATLSAPWHSLGSVAGALGVAGLVGIAYCGVVVRRARRQTEYQPVLEDWLWHSAFPFAAYAAVVIAGVRLTHDPEHSLFVVAGAVLALVLVGIHNAWDTVTYLAVGVRQGGDGAAR
jgi:hypothetical protein